VVEVTVNKEEVTPGLIVTMREGKQDVNRDGRPGKESGRRSKREGSSP
jgi:hypothetical protein